MRVLVGALFIPGQRGSGNTIICLAVDEFPLSFVCDDSSTGLG